MSIEIRLPNITGLTEREQLQQVKSYLIQLAQQLQWALNNVSSSSEQNAVQQVSSRVDASALPSGVAAQYTFNAIKPLIIKSNDIIEAYYEAINTQLEGIYVAKEAFEELAYDSLTPLVCLTATDENSISLNDIKTPDVYFSPDAQNSRRIADSPYTDGGFVLEVRELHDKSFILQTMFFETTRLCRRWNGSKWSEWLRVLMISHGESVNDFVTEAGSSNGWTYKKWKNGTYEMFGQFSVTATAAGTAIGSLYYSEYFTLPVPFAGDKVCIMGMASDLFVPVGCSASEDGSNTISFRLYSPMEFDARATAVVRLHVTGTLK